MHGLPQSARAAQADRRPNRRACCREARLGIPQTCARCHSAIYDTYKASVHGAALTGEGNLDVPTCIDCHGVHNIQNPTTARFRNATPQLCAKCHTDRTLMSKYGISTDVLDTYVADFHGTTVTLFEQVSPDTPTNKPVCTDCHGVHDISLVDNPTTGIAIKENLLVKCQRCHPGVTSAGFTDAWMSHYVASPTKFPLVYYVNLFYKIFIPDGDRRHARCSWPATSSGAGWIRGREGRANGTQESPPRPKPACTPASACLPGCSTSSCCFPSRPWPSPGWCRSSRSIPFRFSSCACGVASKTCDPRITWRPPY